MKVAIVAVYEHPALDGQILELADGHFAATHPDRDDAVFGSIDGALGHLSASPVRVVLDEPGERPRVIAPAEEIILYVKSKPAPGATYDPTPDEPTQSWSPPVEMLRQKAIGKAIDDVRAAQKKLAATYAARQHAGSDSRDLERAQIALAELVVDGGFVRSSTPGAGEIAAVLHIPVDAFKADRDDDVNDDCLGCAIEINGARFRVKAIPVEDDSLMNQRGTSAAGDEALDGLKQLVDSRRFRTITIGGDRVVVVVTPFEEV